MLGDELLLAQPARAIYIPWAIASTISCSRRSSFLMTNKSMVVHHMVSPDNDHVTTTLTNKVALQYMSRFFGFATENKHEYRWIGCSKVVQLMIVLHNYKVISHARTIFQVHRHSQFLIRQRTPGTGNPNLGCNPRVRLCTWLHKQTNPGSE